MPRTTRHGWTAEEAKPETRPCDSAGCLAEGLYRAPRSRTDLTSYFWFCLDHVRQYNSAWNYFSGMSESQIEAHIRADTVWQRPSWPLGRNGGGQGRFHFHDGFEFFANEAEPRQETRRKVTRTPEDEAAAVLDLDAPITVAKVKARYKVLVKKHHPDANGGDKAAEERLRVIIQAYKTLMASLTSDCT